MKIWKKLTNNSLKERYIKLVSSEKNRVCYVQYEVFVKDPCQKQGIRSNKTNETLEKEKRLLRRKINFIEVSSHILSAYYGYGVSEKVTHMLKCSKKSFQ